MTNLIQIPIPDAPLGITGPIALLDADWRDFGIRLNIEFESGRDDLDDLYAACVKMVGGTCYGLVYHLECSGERDRSANKGIPGKPGAQMG